MLGISLAAPASVSTSVESPVSGQKRKWTDMRESSSTQVLHQPENHGGGKKKKKQKKERQAQQRAAASASHKPQRNAPVIQSMDGANLVDYPGFPYTPNPFDGYYPYGMGFATPMDAYQSAGASFLSPEDEYRPTDGPLWNPTERPSTLSALAPPWYPPNALYSSHESHSAPSRSEVRTASPPPDPPPPSSSSTQAPAADPTPSSSPSSPSSLDLSTMLQQPFDSSLSERLKQLEAISASLLALANGQRTTEAISSMSSVGPIHLPPADPPPIRREPPPPPRNVPEVTSARPQGTQGESQKRLIGMLEDKGNNGFFDLTVSSLEPPAAAAPIPPVTDFTLVMAHLPKRFRKSDFVMSWAKRHGTPVRVVVDVKNGKALVEWVGAHSVESAFTSIRLRGDGKEHIRVYRYRGDKPPPAPPPQAQGAAKVEKEMEEGEIEEGEVVEVGGKSKKKRNKGKKKTVELEHRLTEPTTSAAVSSPPPAEARPPPPHLSVLRDIDLAAVLSAVSRVPAATQSAPREPRPQLIDRFTDPPAVVATHEEAEEEEMELESDEEPSLTPAVAPPMAPAPSAESSDYQEEDMDLDDGDDDGDDADVEGDEEEDMDMDMSSPSPGPKSTPLPALPDPPALAPTIKSPPSPPQHTSDLPHHETIDQVAPAPPDSIPQVPDEDNEIAAAKEARRHKLEEAIARTKAELAMRALVTSSRTSLVSSTGSSESPEPMTPADSPVVGHVEVAFASSAPNGAAGAVPRKAFVEEVKPTVKVKTEAVALDDLAASFISQTIHAAAASPPVPTPTTSTPTDAARTAPASATSATATTRRLSVSIPAPKSTAPVMIPLSEEQKQIKQKKWLELVTASKSLFAKIAAAKNKEEKDLLMRLLRAKTK